MCDDSWEIIPDARTQKTMATAIPKYKVIPKKEQLSRVTRRLSEKVAFSVNLPEFMKMIVEGNFFLTGSTIIEGINGVKFEGSDIDLILAVEKVVPYLVKTPTGNTCLGEWLWDKCKEKEDGKINWVINSEIADGEDYCQVYDNRLYCVHHYTVGNVKIEICQVIVDREDYDEPLEYSSIIKQIQSFLGGNRDMDATANFLTFKPYNKKFEPYLWLKDIDSIKKMKTPVRFGYGSYATISRLEKYAKRGMKFTNMTFDLPDRLGTLWIIAGKFGIDRKDVIKEVNDSRETQRAARIDLEINIYRRKIEELIVNKTTQYFV